MKLEDDEGKMFHIKIKPGYIGEYVLLPGDPNRCLKIAKHFDDAKLIGDNREYIIYTGFFRWSKSKCLLYMNWRSINCNSC